MLIKGIPGAHPASGAVDVVVTDAMGAPLATGVEMFRYWTPAEINNLDVYLDADKGVTADAAAKVTSWIGTRGAGAMPATLDFQAAAAVDNQPTRENAVFGPLPSIRFKPQAGAVPAGQFLTLGAGQDLGLQGASFFAVAKWTAPTAGAPVGNTGNVPLTIVGDRAGGHGAFGASGGAIECNFYVGGPAYVDRAAGLNDGVARLIGATYEKATTSNLNTVTKIYVGNNQQGVDHNHNPFIANIYDSIGAGAPNGDDGWDGDIGAVIIVSGEVSVEDRTKLDMWSQQRWGTPKSAPLDSWSRITLGPMPAGEAAAIPPIPTWHVRDGAQMVQIASGRILLIGGWNPYQPWGRDTTNEVWASDDRGVTWSLLLEDAGNPPKAGPGARFPPGHTVGVTTYKGHAVVIGSDPKVIIATGYLGEVWHESDDGRTWTLVATDAPTKGRSLFMIGKLLEDIYMMGGQENGFKEWTGIADTWRSSDGGVTWKKLDNLNIPWAPRGMVYRPVEHCGQLILVGGGRYDDSGDEKVFNGVFAFDGVRWTSILDDGHGQFAPSTYNSVAALGSRIWLFNGNTGGNADYSRAVYSDNGGVTWAEFPGGSGGGATHADAVLAISDRILRIPGPTGSFNQRLVYAFVNRPEPPA